MNDIIEAFIHDHLYLHLVLIAVSMTAIIIAMGVDFISGIQKAKQRGELRTSKKYKMTATKAKKYFNPFLTLVMIDLICCIVIPFPVFAMLWAAYCVFCEFKSVREKSWEKAELRKAEKTMSIIIENKDDIAKLAAQILFETKVSFSLKLWHTVTVLLLKPFKLIFLISMTLTKMVRPTNLKMLLCDGHRHVRTILTCILPQLKSVRAYLVILF